MHRLIPLFIPILALGAASVGRAQAVVATAPASMFKVDTGVTFSRGNYGLATDTTVWIVPFSLSYDAGPWVVRATLPWVTISGPASVIGDGAIGTGAGTGTGTSGPVRPDSGRASGLGDSILAFTYKLNPGADRLNLDLTGKIKFPTGDDARGIGTGRVDYYAQVDLYRTFNGITPFATLGYRWLGDGRYQLEDGAFVSGGVLFTVAPGTSVGVSYDWRARLIAGGDDANEASVLLFRRFDDHWSGMISVMKGFTDASADYGFSTQVTYAF